MVACLILVPGAYSIEVGFSAENGGESVSLKTSYAVDTDVSVSEESTASFDQLAIRNTRSVSGTGDINANQAYSGSGGYTGSATLSSQGVCGSLRGSAYLAPEYLSANQDVSLSGSFVDTGMSLAYEGDSADIGVAILSGSINSGQRIETGSVNNEILANIEAQVILYRELVNILGNEVNTLTTINTPTSSPVVLNAVADSHTGSNLAYRASGGNINVDDSQKIRGPDGIEVNLNTQVINAESCTRSPVSAHVSYSGNREAFTAINADYIYASASVGKDWTPAGYTSGGSEVEVTVNHGSLEGYSNQAYLDGTSFIASQSAKSASGNSYSPYSTTVSFSQGASNAGGELVTSIYDVTGNSKVEGYSSDVTSGNLHFFSRNIGVFSNQRADSASGTWVISSQEGMNNEHDLVRGSFWNQGGSNGASVSGYSDHVGASKSNVDLSQNIDKTSGVIIFAGSRAINNYNKDENKDDAEALVSTNIYYNAELEGYKSTAEAHNGISATASQNIYSASGDRVILSGDAYKTNENPDNSGPYYRYNDGMASSSTEVYDGLVRGYSNSVRVEKGGFFSWPGEYRVSSSQKVDYAEGDSISVGAQSYESKQSYYEETQPYEGVIVGREHASIWTTVTDGNIFLYSDSSEAKYPSALNIYSQTLPPLPMSEAKASVDVNAVGTSIEVKTNADGGSFSENGKLSASIGVKDESNQNPIITKKEEWKGLAFMAIQSNALKVGPLNPGHAGMGVWNEDGTWTIGSLQGGPRWNPALLFGASILPGYDNNGWYATDLTWLEVVELLSYSKIENFKVIGTTPGVCTNTRPGDSYDKIKMIRISGDPNPIEAEIVMADFENRGFWFGGLKYGILIPTPLDPPYVIEAKLAAIAELELRYHGNKYWPSFSNDCLDASVDALNAYLPSDEKLKIPPAYRWPNDYFAEDVKGKEYIWNSELGLFTCPTDSGSAGDGGGSW